MFDVGSESVEQYRAVTVAYSPPRRWKERKFLCRDHSKARPNIPNAQSTHLCYRSVFPAVLGMLYRDDRERPRSGYMGKLHKKYE